MGREGVMKDKIRGLKVVASVGGGHPSDTFLLHNLSLRVWSQNSMACFYLFLISTTQT